MVGKMDLFGKEFRNHITEIELKKKKKKRLKKQNAKNVDFKAGTKALLINSFI